jgi:MscS family membrane protein
MSLIKEKRPVIRRAHHWTQALVPGFSLLLLIGSTALSLAQLPKHAAPPPSKTEAGATVDPLGRETPRSAVMGLLKYGEREDFATAARFLQVPADQSTNLPELGKQFLALHSRFKGNLGMLSDDPGGSVEAGLPPGQVRAGVFEVGGSTTDVILVRVDDPNAGEIWLVSKETVAKIPELYAQVESEGPTAAERIAPAALTHRHMLGMSLAQWLGWLLSIPVSWLLAWLLTFLLSAPRRIWYKLRRLPFSTIWETPIGMPIRCINAILLHGLFVYLLEPPLLYRVYYARFLAALLVGCFAWLVSTIADRGFDHLVNRTRTQRAGGESILILMQRLTRVALLIVAFVAALAIFGINVKTTLAGLGIGGLALALGAQKSLENLLGGIFLLMDKAVHVGNFCKIGNQVGTVEDIGLRSVKVRTLDQSLLVVPNGTLAQMQFENFGPRRKCLINQHFSLRIETQVEQLRFVLDRVQSMLNQQPAVETGSRVRVSSFVGAAFELELWAYVKTSDWTEFTGIRQDVILKIAEIVEAAGTRFAAPTQLTYLSRDSGVEAEKGNDIVRHETELRATDASRLPGEARTRAE